MSSINVLMMSWVAGYFPHPQYQAILCSSGSKGYSAFRRSLEPGYPEHTILLTNVDVRDMQQPQEEDEKELPNSEERLTQSSPFSGIVRISQTRLSFGVLSNPPPSAMSTWLSRSNHVSIFGNVSALPYLFLDSCDALKTIDFSGLQGCVTTLGDGFLENCSSLTEINFAGLENLEMLPSAFLAGCSGLKTISFKGLLSGGGSGSSSKISTLPSSFLRGNTTLESIDLTGLENVRDIPSAFLAGCSGLTTIDLTPLHQVTEIPLGFLHTCINLKSIIFPKSCKFSRIPPMFLFGCQKLETVDLALFRCVPAKCPLSFLVGCTALTTINNPPPFSSPPPGWLVMEKSNHPNICWVKEHISS